MAFISRQDMEVMHEADGVACTVVSHHSTGSAMLTLLDMAFPSGAAVSVHVCPNTETNVLVLEGQFSVMCSGQEHAAGAGDCVYIPAGAARSYKCGSGGAGRLLVFSPHPEPEVLQGGDAASGGAAGVYRCGERQEFLPGVLKRDATGAALGARRSFISDMLIQPGGEIPLHYHPDHDECIYCVEGEVMLAYGDEAGLRARGGDVLLGELRIPHGIRNEGSAAARVLALSPTTKPERIFLD